MKEDNSENICKKGMMILGKRLRYELNFAASQFTPNQHRKIALAEHLSLSKYTTSTGADIYEFQLCFIQSNRIIIIVIFVGH